MSNKRVDEPTGVETVGHEWDGIEELNNPLPRWWVTVLGMTVVFALGYVAVYPAIPLGNAGSPGLWGWTSRGALAQDTARAEAERLPMLNAIGAAGFDAIMADHKLLDFAKAGGRAAFKQNCAQCHGSDGSGSNGYPNLKDSDWLWGGDLAAIQTTIQHGVRAPGESQTRTSLMPSFGADGILQPAQINDVAAHVRALSGAGPKDAAAARGAPLFAANCAVCHGADGTGSRQVGAPNLADQVWLYGGRPGQVVASITTAHAGVMPAWQSKLDPVTIKMLAVYVHSLGGGEKFAAPAAAPTPAMAVPADGESHAKP